MTRVLPDVPGREGLIETVVLAPGEVLPAHRHNADVFAYVLEGCIITRVEGRDSQTVHAGEVFYESPTDLHLGSRNASTTQPATLLVFFVKKIGTPSTIRTKAAMTMAPPAVTDAKVEIVFDPPWDCCKMSDAAKLKREPNRSASALAFGP
jgi:quercetin dioxygenase-like cupin family protein